MQSATSFLAACLLLRASESAHTVSRSLSYPHLHTHPQSIVCLPPPSVPAAYLPAFAPASASAAMLVLFETPAGYALFKLLDKTKIAKAEDVYKHFDTVEHAQQVYVHTTRTWTACACAAVQRARRTSSSRYLRQPRKCADAVRH